MRSRAAAVAAVLAGAAVQMGTGRAAADPPAPVDLAWTWIQSQLGTGTPVVSDGASIAPDADYPASWTGPVSGTATPPPGATLTPAAVAVDAPAAAPGSYSGVVQGHVTLPAQANRWIIQVYRDGPSGRAQVPLQALAAPDGSFTVDLAAAGPQPAGEWALGVLDAAAGYAPAGTAWPDPGVYDGWTVRSLVTTDVTYPIDSVPLRGDGGFAFPYSPPGTKTFQLVDAAGAVHAEHAPDFGLVRSFGSPDGTDERSYTYDQALALITAIGLGEDAAAQQLTRGLLALQTPSGAQAGAFVEVSAARNPAAARPIYRTGITSFAAYALLLRLQTLPAADPTAPAVAAAATAAVDYLVGHQRADGLIPGGSGTVQPDGSIDPAALDWVSTEHSLDAWHTLTLASTVLPGSGGSAAAQAAADLQSAIVSLLWNVDRFRQGLAPSGAPDDTDALDASSWGAIFLTAIGRSDLADLALDHAALFADTDAGLSGYRPYYPQPNLPAAPSVVWLEGTAGVAVAAQRLGRTGAYDGTVADLAAAQLASGAIPYASSTHAGAGLTSSPSIAATAWFILAARDGAGPIIWA